MCRWGCTTTDTTYMCKFCGTRYCRECGRGDFHGTMKDSTTCHICFQVKCQGVRVEYVPRPAPPREKSATGKKGSVAKGKAAKKTTTKDSKKSGKKSGKKKKK